MKSILKAAALAILIGIADNHTVAQTINPQDTEDAMQWCDTHPLDRIEGIWSYPEDRVTVLISRVKGQDHQYVVTAVSSEGLSVIPGEKIGEVYSTADPDRFRIRLFTTRKKGMLGKPADCAARLTAGDYGLTVAAKKRTWTFNPFAFLPYFWRIARTSVSDPLKSLPVGMQKIYPSYDGNGSSRFHVRYL